MYAARAGFAAGTQAGVLVWGIIAAVLLLGGLASVSFSYTVFDQVSELIRMLSLFFTLLQPSVLGDLQPPRGHRDLSDLHGDRHGSVSSSPAFLFVKAEPIPAAGGVFSTLSLIFKEHFDVTASVSYIGIVVLDGIMFASISLLPPPRSPLTLSAALQSSPRSDPQPSRPSSSGTRRPQRLRRRCRHRRGGKRRRGRHRGGEAP